MTLVTIERRIVLDAIYLDNNIMVHILNKVRLSMINECTKDFGYILNVIRLIEIKDNCISSATSDIVFSVIFEADILKPVEGKNLTGTVCLISSAGVFLNVQDKLNILIPRSTISEYVFKNNTYVKDDLVIKKNDVVVACITNIQYSKKKFNCIGRIID